VKKTSKQLLAFVCPVIISAVCGAGKIFKIGKQAINSRLEAYYNVENPDAAPDWTIAFTFQFLFPK